MADQPDVHPAETELDEVERRVRALARVGDPATHETVVQVVLTIVDEVRSARAGTGADA